MAVDVRRVDTRCWRLLRTSSHLPLSGANVLLPVPGRVTVRLEQKVNPLDVVAEANFGAEHLLIDVARTLGLKPDAAQRLIQVKAGDIISQGEVIARQTGLRHAKCPCPKQWAGDTGWSWTGPDGSWRDHRLNYAPVSLEWSRAR